MVQACINKQRREGNNLQGNYLTVPETVGYSEIMRRAKNGGKTMARFKISNL